MMMNGLTVCNTQRNPIMIVVMMMVKISMTHIGNSSMIRMWMR